MFTAILVQVLAVCMALLPFAGAPFTVKKKERKEKRITSEYILVIFMTLLLRRGLDRALTSNETMKSSYARPEVVLWFYSLKPCVFTKQVTYIA